MIRTEEVFSRFSANKLPGSFSALYLHIHLKTCLADPLHPVDALTYLPPRPHLRGISFLRPIELVCHVCGISAGADFLPSLTKLPQCDGGHVFEGLSRKMNLLFDTPLPLAYCEIWLVLVLVLSQRSMCLRESVQGVFCRTTITEELKL